MRYLFVGGPARSGTTGFAQLINRHPRVAIGIERYKFLYPNLMRRSEVGPNLFQADRFFQFLPDETNIGPARLGSIDAFKEKHAVAAYRGDKIPHVMRYRRVLENAFPLCRFIIMYRDVTRICSSWNQRAQDTRDHWAEHNNFTNAVGAINRELGAAVRYQKKNQSRCLIVRYENIFGPGAVDTMKSVLDWLDLPHSPHLMKAVQANLVKAEKIRAKPLVELEGQREFIRNEIDWAVIDQVENLAI